MRGAFFSGGDGSSRVVGNIIRDDSHRAQGTNLNYLGGKNLKSFSKPSTFFDWSCSCPLSPGDLCLLHGPASLYLCEPRNRQDETQRVWRNNGKIWQKSDHCYQVILDSAIFGPPSWRMSGRRGRTEHAGMLRYVSAPLRSVRSVISAQFCTISLMQARHRD